MLVFPTDWSPKNTSLYLASGETVAAGVPITSPLPIDIPMMRITQHITQHLLFLLPLCLPLSRFPFLWPAHEQTQNKVSSASQDLRITPDLKDQSPLLLDQSQQHKSEGLQWMLVLQDQIMLLPRSPWHYGQGHDPLSLCVSREEEGGCCRAGSNHSNNDEKRKVPCKEREQERAIRVPGKRGYQNLVESQENSVPSFPFPTPLNFVT